MNGKTPATKDRDLRLLVVNTMATRMSRPEALTYLKSQGYDIGSRQYDRLKKIIRESRHTRISEIANTGFVDAHLEAIDTFVEIKREMWKQYRLEEHPYKKVEILTQIANLQPYINEYYASTKEVMEDNMLKANKDKLDAEVRDDEDRS